MLNGAEQSLVAIKHLYNKVHCVQHSAVLLDIKTVRRRPQIASAFDLNLEDPVENKTIFIPHLTYLSDCVVLFVVLPSVHQGTQSKIVQRLVLLY